jgi:hypothetical protein
MMVNNKEICFDELSNKILLGINKAVCKLVEKTAAENGSLIIGNIDGTCKDVPAKKLLKILNQES